jgi:hypothetical protein
MTGSMLPVCPPTGAHPPQRSSGWGKAPLGMTLASVASGAPAGRANSFMSGTVLNVPVKRSPQLPVPKQLPQTHSVEQRRSQFEGSALFRTLRTYLELALNLGRRFICFSTMGHTMPTTMKAHVKALPPR